MKNDCEKLIRKLRNRRIALQAGLSGEDFPLLMEAADAIEELSRKARELPRWIPATDRLPEKEKKSYLCRTDGGYHCEVRWTDNKYGLWSGGGGEWGWSIFDIPQYSKVTHWMPLPEPPKEET